MLVTGAPGREGLAGGLGKASLQYQRAKQTHETGVSAQSPLSAALSCGPGDAGCPALTCVEGKVQRRK